MRITALDVDPTGRQVVVITEDGAGQSTLSLWDYEHPLQALTSATLAGRQLVAVAFSKFRHDLYVISRAGNEHRIERYPVKQGGLEKPTTVYKSSAALTRLVVPFLRFGGAERLFFGREYSTGRYQIFTVRADGKVPYEVTSPSGTLTTLTAPEVSRAPPSEARPEEASGPGVEKARSALPMSIHPLSGALIYESEDHTLRTREYGSSWHASKKVAATAPGAQMAFSPNGLYKLRTLSEQAGAELLTSDGRVVERVGSELRFALPPLFLPSGRALLAAVQLNDGVRLKVVPITDKLAGVRYLPDMQLPREHLDALSRTGMLFAETQTDQIYEPYEQLDYTECHAAVKVPIYATVDGFMEVLSAGFQAVFMITEQKVARPRLATFSKLLSDSAKRQQLPRLVEIAEVTRKVLDGNYATVEGRKILAESPALSALHTVPQPLEVDFSDFKPRGPYAATTTLKNYFRAFKYMNLLQLTDAEKTKLRGDTELMKAFNAWIDTQRPFMSGSRRPGILDDRQPPAFTRLDCIPEMARVPSLFPLSFGIDSEIMESTVARSGVAKDCTVSGRLLPSGLDLMTGLGSPTAQSLQQKEYSMFAELKAAHDSLRGRFAKPLGSAQLPEAWFRLVQILGSDDYVPAGVDPDPWRRRLLSTALASWTSFRHTTVLVNEEMAAECGGGYDGFESLVREPVRGVVDPLPQSWEQLAVILEMLSHQATRAVSDTQVGEVLATAAKTARSFRSMAERQMKGVPLDEEEYATIQKYSGQVEHPYLLLKSTLSQFQDLGMVAPDPMMKIVSIASAGPQHLQVALGHPLQVTALLADRGLQVAATGAIYSYYEVVDGKRMTDEQWRKRIDQSPRPTPPPWAQFELRRLWSHGDSPPDAEPN